MWDLKDICKNHRVIHSRFHQQPPRDFSKMRFHKFTRANTTQDVSEFIANKETNRLSVALNFGQSGKGRSNPRWYDTKKLPHTTCRKLLLDPQYKIGDQNKIAESLNHSLLE